MSTFQNSVIQCLTDSTDLKSCVQQALSSEKATVNRYGYCTPADNTYRIGNLQRPGSVQIQTYIKPIGFVTLYQKNTSSVEDARSQCKNDKDNNVCAGFVRKPTGETQFYKTNDKLSTFKFNNPGWTDYANSVNTQCY